MIARLQGLRGDDRGTSLMELVVAMGIMSIFLAIFTTSIVLMTSDTNKVQAATATAGEINAAYLHLDQTVRYASAISTPGTSTASGYWYVEFSVPGVASTSTCTQLRVDTDQQQLQERTWPVDASGNASSAPSPFTPLASEITNGDAAANTATTPFVISTSASSLFQQLTVNLVATTQAPATNTENSDTTFTAMNSSASSSSNICTQSGRP